MPASEVGDFPDHFVRFVISDMCLNPDLSGLESVGLKGVRLKCAWHGEELFRATYEPRRGAGEIAVLQRECGVS
jgi:hypothetical protein